MKFEITFRPVFEDWSISEYRDFLAEHPELEHPLGATIPLMLRVVTREQLYVEDHVTRAPTPIDRLLVVSFTPFFRRVIMGSLAEVEKKEIEQMRAEGRTTLTPIHPCGIRWDIPLKDMFDDLEFFRQTALTMSYGKGIKTPGTYLFAALLRTEFTVNEFFKEFLDWPRKNKPPAK